jgi:hypothetical protein
MRLPSSLRSLEARVARVAVEWQDATGEFSSFRVTG